MQDSIGNEEDSTAENKLVTVISWGRSDFGALLRRNPRALEQIDQSAISSNSIFSEQSSELWTGSPLIQVSANIYHSAAVTATGELYTCGQNDEGQVSDEPEMQQIIRPRQLESLANHRVVSVSCGLKHTVCITASGCAISFGGNESGQLGHTGQKRFNVSPKVVNFTLPPRKSALIITKVACGDCFSLFLTTVGEVYGCGSASYLGNPLNTSQLIVSQAERIEGFVGSNIINIAAGASHGLALAGSGELYGWGSNRHCELGFENSSSGAMEEELLSHQQLPKLLNIPFKVGEEILGMSAGNAHTLIWNRKGLLYGAGSNKYGQLGLLVPRVDSFQRIELPHFCVMASCGYNHSIALCNSSSVLNSDALTGPLIRLSSINFADDGSTKIFAFGTNNFGQVSGSMPESMLRQPVELVDLPKTSRILYVSAGGDHSFALAVQDSSSRAEDKELLKKKFSTIASKAALPMSASSLLALLNKTLDAENDPKLVDLTLTTVCDIFSSPSLLSASFFGSKNVPSYQSIDVEGVDACYTAMVRMGTHAIARLLGAVQQTITELERAVASSSGASLPDSSVRVFLILWQSPIMADPIMSSALLLRLLTLISPSISNLLSDTIASNFPAHIFAARLLKPILEHIDFHVAASADSPKNSTVELLCNASMWLFAANARANIIPNEKFYNKAISSLSEQTLVLDYVHWRQQKLSRSAPNANPSSPQVTGFFFSSFPYLISAEAKRRMLLGEAGARQQAAQQQAFTHGILSGSGIVMPFFIMPIERGHLLQQALLHIANASNHDLQKPLKVIFIGEEGVDEGGVRKEFFQLLTVQLFDLQYGMFVSINHGRHLWLNMQNSWSIDEYSLVGSLLGLALYNGVILDVHLPQVLYKKLLRRPLTLEDLSTVDPELYQGLRHLLNHSPASEVEDVYCRSFVAEWEEFGAKMTHELIPNGASQAVTGENRQLYVEKLVQWILVDSVETQFQALYQGFTRVVHPSQLLLVSPLELELMMVGTPHLDFKELEQNTEYIGDSEWSAEHQTIRWFWTVVHDLPFEEKQRLLTFITGSNKAPIGGLRNIGLKIQRNGPDSSSLPTAHTCFNTLLLPAYSSLEKLRDRLLTAISECEGFGLR